MLGIIFDMRPCEIDDLAVPSRQRPRGHWAVGRQGELDNQPVGLDHGLNPIQSSNHSS